MLETYSSRTPRHPKVSTKHQNHQWHPSRYVSISIRGKGWVAEQDRKTEKNSLPDGLGTGQKIKRENINQCKMSKAKSNPQICVYYRICV